MCVLFPAEAQAEEPAAEAAHGPTPQPHLGNQLYAGCQKLSHTHTHPHTFFTTRNGQKKRGRVVQWMYDYRVLQTGSGCTLQEKRGL